MEYIYAAMLLHKAGKEITEDALKSVLSSAGVSLDEGRVKATVSALKGVNIDEAVSKASVAPVAATAPAGAPSGESKPTEKVKPKEEAKEASEEAASAGLGALFG